MGHLYPHEHRLIVDALRAFAVSETRCSVCSHVGQENCEKHAAREPGAVKAGNGRETAKATPLPVTTPVAAASADKRGEGKSLPQLMTDYTTALVDASDETTSGDEMQAAIRRADGIRAEIERRFTPSAERYTHAFKVPIRWRYNAKGQVQIVDADDRIVPIENVLASINLGATPSATARSEWIRCSERLPEHGENVLFVTGRNPDFMWYGWRDEDGEVERWRDHFDDDVICKAADVTHWMPAPATPGSSTTERRND